MRTKTQIETSNKITNWSNRIEILTLKNQGWSLRQIANKLGISNTSVTNTYHKIKNKSLDELEEMRRKYE